VRSVSQRLERTQDAVDGLDERLAKLSTGSDLDQRLAIEGKLDEVGRGKRRCTSSSRARRGTRRATRSVWRSRPRGSAAEKNLRAGRSQE
jgi:hypothetical protein